MRGRKEGQEQLFSYVGLETYVPHSYAYLPDFGETMAAVGSADDEAAIWRRSWIVPHASAVTTAELEALLGEMVEGARVNATGRLMLQFGALFVPAAREMIEMLYEFEEPFTVDSTETERELGLSPIPLREGLERTIAWYRRSGGDSARFCGVYSA